MSCTLDTKLLYCLADGTIEPLERVIVEEHLKYCSECKKELEIIKEIDRGISSIYSDILIPQRLSAISELVVENCMHEVENNDSRVKIRNYNKDMKVLRNIIFEGYKAQYNNPYNKFIQKSISGSINLISKPIKKYCNKKISKSIVGKLFKVV